MFSDHDLTGTGFQRIYSVHGLKLRYMIIFYTYNDINIRNEWWKSTKILHNFNIKSKLYNLKYYYPIICTLVK